MELLVNIDVNDLPEAIRFYEQALGLRLGRLLFEGSVAELLGAAAPVYLLAKADGTACCPEQRRDYRRHWTPVHLDFVVEDLDAAVHRALEAGARLEGEVLSQPYGRLATFADPFGHGFCLIEWKGEGYAEVAESDRLAQEET